MRKIIKTGKELIIEYCKDIKSNSVEHLENCKNILEVLNEELTLDKYFNYLDGLCPNVYLPEHIKIKQKFNEDCNEENIDNSNCAYCWYNALNTKFNLDNNHNLKTLPKYFKAVKSGKKTFEVIKYDRDYKIGDTLTLQEWNNDYTGDEIVKTIIFILGREEDEKIYVPDGYVILGIK